MLIYMAHPVDAYTDDHGLYWLPYYNILVAKNYLAAMNRRGLHVIAPWIGLCESLGDSSKADRDHGMEVGLNVLGRCDAIVLCGPHVDAGMQAEIDHASREGLRVYSVVGMYPREAADGLLTLVKEDLDES